MFLALAFVTLPFVVRTVQPVLEELERDVEEAAASLGAEPVHDLPPGRSCPSWSRRSPPARRCRSPAAISEYGSLVLLSGNLPGRTEVASVRVLTYIENGNTAAAAAVAAILLLVALLVIVAARHHPAEGGPPWRAQHRHVATRPPSRWGLRAGDRRLRVPARRLADRAGGQEHLRRRARRDPATRSRDPDVVARAAR